MVLLQTKHHSGPIWQIINQLAFFCDSIVQGEYLQPMCKQPGILIIDSLMEFLTSTKTEKYIFV